MEVDHRRAFRLATCLLILPYLSCGGDSGPTAPSAQTPTPGSISVAIEAPILGWLGQTTSGSATVRDQAGNAMPNKTVTWSSTSPSVATVSSTGEATAVGNGDTRIRASVDGVSGEAALTVEQRAASLTPSVPDVVFASLGDTVRLLVQGADEGGSPLGDLAVLWASEDATVASVDQEGLVTSWRQGSTTILATGGEVEARIGVSVVQTAVQLAIVAERDTLVSLGEMMELAVEGRDALGSLVPGLAAIWSTNNPGVVSISASGEASAVSNGSARIGAAVEGLEADILLFVVQQGVQLHLATQPTGAAAGEPFSGQPQLEVLDAGGSLVGTATDAGVTVSLASGTGELLGTVLQPIVGGEAAFGDLAIGGTAGEFTLRFEVPGLAAVVSDPFVLAVGAAARLLRASGDGQVALADTELGDSLAVSVVDAWENNVSGVSVAWSITAGAGSLSGAQVATDAAGRASVAYTLGRNAGDEIVHAESPGLADSPIVFSLTATPNGTISGVVSLTTAHLMTAGTGTTIGSGGPAPAGSSTTSLNATSQSAPPGAPSRPVRSGADRPQLPGGASEGAASDRRSPLISGPEFTADELIVMMRPEALGVPQGRGMAARTPSEAREVSARIRAALDAPGQARSTGYRTTGVSPASVAARIRVDNPSDLSAIASRLRADPGVASVERNRIIYRPQSGGEREVATQPFEPPVNDPLYPWQAWHYEMIELPAAWDITTGHASVVVAVVDDGIRFDHPDLAGRLTNDGYDFVSNRVYQMCGGGEIDAGGDGDGWDPDPTIPVATFLDELAGCVSGVNESGGHGLHVAATIGASTNDGFGLAGAAPGTSIRPVRVLDISGRGTIWDIGNGIMYAAGIAVEGPDGQLIQAAGPAHVINLSLGGSSPSDFRQLAVELAADAGSLLIASAGNAGTTAPNYPAAYPDVVSVSAVDPYKQLATYSSYGPAVELAAPGGQLEYGCSFGVVSATWNFQTSQPRSACWQGTSMAAPHVSGVAALIFAHEPGITAAQVRSRLRDWAVDLGAPGWDQEFGYGLVNARNSLAQTFEPDGNVHVVLYDASTGAELGRMPAASDGSFEFRERGDGAYLVFAGRDREGDGLIGLPGRRWGGFGGSMNPGAVTVDGAGVYAASFSIGFPIEQEPNNSFADANKLILGAYVRGFIDGIDYADVDGYWISLPEAGTYTFETSPISGACGFAAEENTYLQLYDAAGTLVAENRDIDAAAYDYCSRITGVFPAGDYSLAVWGNAGNGRYQLHARIGG